MKSNIYLTFNGNCEVAFTFYKSVLNVEFTHLGRFKEIPPSDDFKVPKEDENKIMHVALPFGDVLLMGSDTGSEYASSFVQGNNFSLSIHPETREQADELFSKLSVNGRVNMPMADAFWGDYFGMLTDQFGIQWMVNFNPNGAK
jgi:PhnB protein